MKISVSAPGKLMLLGEHAVVYNRPCLVTSVDQRMRVSVESIKEEVFFLDAPDVKVSNYKKPISELGKGDIPKGAKFVEIAVANFSKKHKIIGGLKVKTKSQFSSLFGFGSSSASTVCTIFALSALSRVKLSKKEVFDLSYKTVLDIQGRGSGFDVAAATFGGILYFFTGGKVIEPLKIKTLPLVVGYSGTKADSVTLMNQVSQREKKYPRAVKNIYDQIKDLVETGKKVLLKKDFQTFGELMDLDQGYLSTLGVSTKKLEDMIYSSREAGAYGAKLSGAGGGDCMIALTPENKRLAVSRAINSVGGEVIKVDLGVEGVRIEKK